MDDESDITESELEGSDSEEELDKQAGGSPNLEDMAFDLRLGADKTQATTWGLSVKAEMSSHAINSPSSPSDEYVKISPSVVPESAKGPVIELLPETPPEIKRQTMKPSQPVQPPQPSIPKEVLQASSTALPISQQPAIKPIQPGELAAKTSGSATTAVAFRTSEKAPITSRSAPVTRTVTPVRKPEPPLLGAASTAPRISPVVSATTVLALRMNLTAGII